MSCAHTLIDVPTAPAMEGPKRALVTALKAEAARSSGWNDQRAGGATAGEDGGATAGGAASGGTPVAAGAMAVAVPTAGRFAVGGAAVWPKKRVRRLSFFAAPSARLGSRAPRRGSAGPRSAIASGVLRVRLSYA